MKWLFIVLLLAIPSGGKSSVAEPLNNCRLTIAWEDWKPYIFEENGQLQGQEYLYLINLAAKVGCKLQFVQQPWTRSLLNLENYSVDILYGASYTKEREVFAQFSVPYRHETFVFISNDKDSPDITSLLTWLGDQKDESTPKIIGLIRGFYYGEKIEPIVRNPSRRHQIHEVRRDDQLKSMLNFNRIEGFIVEKVVADQMLKHTPSLKISLIEEAQPEPMHLMFSNKVSQDIIKRFNAAISDLKNK